MKSLSQPIFRWLGIDAAVAYVLLTKLWSVGGGLITLSLLTTRLTLPEQGTYYTFANILGLQIFLELGLGFVVMQMASHEVANLTVDEHGMLAGDFVAKSRLGSLFRGAVKIYTVIAGAFLMLILPVGALFFSRNAPAEVKWAGPWCLLVVFAAVAILINPLMAFVEGCGRIVEVERRRFLFAVTGNIISWILLVCGAHLYFAVSLYVVISIGGAVWFWSRHRVWLNDLWRSVINSHVINWRVEVWSFQWRIALSWLSGYFIFQLFNPLVYIYMGASEAGKMGLTLQISGLIGGIAFGWVNTKVALWGMHAARCEWAELDRGFRIVFLKSSLMLLVLLLFVWLGVFLLPRVIVYLPNAAIVNRILDIRARMLSDLAIAAVFACTFSQHIIGCIASYLRSHKKEPLLVVSLTVGFVVAISAYFSARYGSIELVALSWCVTQWLLALPWVLCVFILRRKQWRIN